MYWAEADEAAGVEAEAASEGVVLEAVEGAASEAVARQAGGETFLTSRFHVSLDQDLSTPWT